MKGGMRTTVCQKDGFMRFRRERYMEDFHGVTSFLYRRDSIREYEDSYRVRGDVWCHSEEATENCRSFLKKENRNWRMISAED